MTITGLEAIPLRIAKVDSTANDGTQETVIVKVHTDSGITGIGEVDATPWVIKAILEAPSSHNWGLSFGDLLVGENPLDVERLWEKMYQGTIYPGRRGLGIHAIGAVDLALWDIAGQASGRPVYELLGGPRREFVVPYASVQPPLSSLAETERHTCQFAENVLEAGYRAVKFQLVYREAYTDADVVNLMRLARRTVGDGVTLMLDVGYRWSEVRSAIRTLRHLDDCDLYFVETPIRVDDLDSHARLAEAVNTRIATGEFLATKWEFLDLMDRGKVDVVQPDIARAGGLTESLRVARMADLRGLLCIPHGWKSGVTIAAQIHLSAASTNTPFIEYMEPQLWPSVIRSNLVRPEFAPKGGVIELPTAPGLGVQLNEDVAMQLARQSPVGLGV